ncbi:hypothetical protein ABFS82_01G013600 [Erythranthe guttata]|uniref:serine/threonine-protein kinase EDR1 n=1 Tax=Erythranthe guttata TaxID=4155 RepID=UPI00064D9820|nr:PREDICTED: serine/threonine-protein kinase EDR1 [Erythranthe guttata]|eukprot:XP_012857927.1 PREDICTED: serine/threonine-protein kinase EDR1 [Erythranthe guttata]
MSKMKHLLRKLHIGDHHNQGRPPTAALDPSPPNQTSTSSSLSPPSQTSDLPPETSPSDNEASSNSFNFLEEEFQMQLALAISVSDPGQTCVDSETAQINAVKQISLGRSPSQSLADFLSLRYWSYNVVNYDEKVIDGFYDVCGIDSNLLVQAKMPSLADLEAISVSNNVAYEVVSVNRAVDMELRKLEERVYFISMECRAMNRGLNTSFLVQKIADLVVERMGGPVSDVEEMFRRWRARNLELKLHFNTVVLPLGSLDVGNSRQRALLFKVLADRINLPCKLVKGSYYTGTDEGAVNLIKLDSESEYIIDLMGAPGTLIPAETPSSHLQSFGLDTRSIAGVGQSSFTAPEQGARIRSCTHSVDETAKTRSLSSEKSSMATESIAGKIQTGQLEHDTRDIYPYPIGECEAPVHAGNKTTGRDSHIEDVSVYVTSAAKRPEFSRELSSMLFEKLASAHEDLLSISSDDREGELLESDRIVRREKGVDQCHPEISLLNNELSHVNNIFNDSCRKRSADGLRGNQFKPELAGYKSSFIQGKQNVFVKDSMEMVPNYGAAVGSEIVDFSGNREAMGIAYDDKSDANKIHNMQSDPVLNGVAEILWEDLHIGERIGIGSYGEVYRGEWNGTEVAVKKFMKQDITGDALTQFKCEIEIMLRLRHPNIVLFMGAVTSPPNMSILTEFLPRGSLYKLLHRPNIHIDEKRRIKMALDVAKGMNYLHTSHPIIVHRDLKTPNLLVDKNWIVKVCDFGMSRLQHHTFLSSKSTAGTAEWMAPEVLRNEPSNEKSDVYSFGVILWELATLRVPWTEMNSMQVVGAVGFQGRHLDIPPMVDPLVADIISECWNRNPQARPSFAEIITRLKRLQHLCVQRTESSTN